MKETVKKSLVENLIILFFGGVIGIGICYLIWLLGRGTFFCYYPEMLEKRYDLTIDIDSSCDNADSQVEIRDVYRALNALPDSLLEAFVDDGWKIVVWGDPNDFLAAYNITYSDDYKAVFANGTNNIAGITDHGEKTIYIRISGLSSSKIYSTTIHEFAHYIDQQLNDLSQTKKFNLYRLKNFGYVTYNSSHTETRATYCDTNAAEYFAVTFTDFFLHYDYVAENYPDLAQYFNENVLSQYE